MKVVLINPPRFKGMPVSREDRCETTIPNVVTPHGLVYLAGILEQKHQVDLIDANGYDLNFEYIKEYIKNQNPDLVIFKSTPETFYSDIKVAKITKSIDSDIKTIMICFTLTKVPEEVLKKAENVDVYIIDYDYEKPILEITNSKGHENCNGIAYRDKNNKIQINHPNKEKFDFNSIPMPAWHLLPDLSVYWVQVPSIRPCAFVESMKGCGMGCSFCTISDVKPNFRDAKKVVDEIEYLENRDVKFISFFDATFNINTKRVFEICEELIKRDMSLKWFANVRSNVTKEEAAIMREAGCRGVSIGVESGSQEVLDMNNKKIKIQKAEEAIENLKKSGIKQYASFIVGLPGETLETMNQTKEFVLKTKPTGFQINSLVPYPRSKIYDLAIRRGVFKELKFDNLLVYNTPVSLCNLSVEEINEFRKKIYRDVYLNPGWWISNVNEVLKNPEDIKLGIDYAIKVLKRLIKGVEFET